MSDVHNDGAEARVQFDCLLGVKVDVSSLILNIEQTDGLAYGGTECNGR